MTSRARQFLLSLAMGGIAAIVVSRAVEQAKRPGATKARGERSLSWAYRDPLLLACLEKAEARLTPGETYCLEFDPSRVNPTWLLAMTNYTFWREIPDGPCPSGPNPRRLARVVISRSGAVAIVREAAR